MGEASWAAARSSREGNEHETRAALLAAAAAVFAEAGYTRASIAAITTAAHVSRPTFYLYYGTKSEIFHAVAERVRDQFLAAHEIAGVDAGDPYALGRAASEAFLTAYRENLGLLTVIEHQALADDEIREVWQELQERPKRRMMRYIARQTGAGTAHPAASPEAVAEAVLGMFARYAATLRDHTGDITSCVDELTAMYLRLLGLDE